VLFRALCGALVAVLVLSLPALGGEHASLPAEAADFVPGRLVVRYAPGQTLPGDVLSDLGVARRVVTRIPGVVALELPEPAVERVAARLARDPRVIWVEREGVVRAADVEPNDVRWSEQWGLRTIGTPAAWTHTTGSSAVTIAILDTGVDATHPELVGRVRAGVSFVDGKSATVDDNGHGTATAGVAAATGDNVAGLAGMCWTCTILPIRVLNEKGEGSTRQLAEGIVEAVDQGAHVVNMSLGSDSNPNHLRDAVTYAVSRGVVLIAAAGNAGSSQQFFPAADDWVISVGATDQNDLRAPYSNHTWVEVAAPGCNVATLPLLLSATGYTAPGNCFVGTSSAAPLVAGAAALLLAHTPTATPQQVRRALETTTVAVSGFVHGRIDAAAALAEFADAVEPEPEPEPVPPLIPAEPEPGDEACPEDRVPDAGFTDIRGNTHEHPINCIVWYRVAQGVSADRYGPDLSVTRAQMASFIARALERAGVELSSSGHPFDDIAASPHRENIVKLANAGVVQGTGPRTYSPSLPVRRDQMASFLVRAYELASSEQLQASRSHFTDTRGNVHEPNIDKAAEAGLVRGTADGIYSPALEVRRDQMGSFIARTLERLVARGHMQPN
jgi:hypothetical protein